MGNIRETDGGPEKWHEKLVKEAAKQGWWRSGDTIVAAVSGGPDSMALLHMLQSLAAREQLTVVAAHVNHGFRPEESLRELELVSRYAEQLGVTCETVDLDLPAYIEETGMNAQAAAREKRYAFLRDTAVRHGAGKAALAHHADDQAETVLMSLIRGTGVTGLSGMRSKRSDKNLELIRPLLRMNKTELIRYCEHNSVPYCSDSSNLQRYYFRNVVRLDVLPYLMQFNPRLSQSLNRLAEISGEEDDWMALQAKDCFDRLVRLEKGCCSLSCDDLERLHVALQRRLIKLILSYLSAGVENISFEAIERMRQAAASDAPSTWSMDAGAEVRCLREYDRLRWERVPNGEALSGGQRYHCELSADDGRLEVASAGWSFHWRFGTYEPEWRPPSRFVASFDAERLAFPLHVRNRMPGDRIQPFGLNGSKKVQDMFVDEKIAPSARALYPLLFDAEGALLWIPGIRRSSHAPTGRHSRQVLIIEASHE